MEPFLTIVILRPTPKGIEEGVAPVVVVQPQAVMAKDSQQAAMKAQKLVPPGYDDAADRLEVRVLPFERPAR